MNTNNGAVHRARPAGRKFFFNPGPTNIPDSVLRAMDRATEDFLSDDFKVVLTRTHARLKTALRTSQHLLLYGANGHASWEAALSNVFSIGDKVLILESGHFSFHWSNMARDLGLEVETLSADWRYGVPVSALADRLAADAKHEIKGVLVVHNETATGLVHPLAELRAAIDSANHPALFLVDTISSFASMDVRVDDWGIDIAVGGSQKGLMMIAGLSFTTISARAMEISKTGGLRRSFLNWNQMLTVEPQRFPGTSPVHLIWGLDEALRLLEEEGFDKVLARHARLAAATRAAVNHWGGGGASAAIISIDGLAGQVDSIELLTRDPNRVSDSVTAVLVPDGFDANVMRQVARDRFNLSLGQGLGGLAGRAFRIGHLGDLNEPMLLGALGAIELSMRATGLSHQPGGVDAAIRELSDNPQHSGA